MKKFLALGNHFIGVIIIITTLVLIYLPNYTMLEFLNEYMLLYVLFLIISGLIGLIFQEIFIMYVSFGCAFMLTLFLKYNSNTDLKLPKPNNQPTIGLVHINLSSISSVGSLKKIAADNVIDVVSFQEVTPDWDEILAELFTDSFPYHYIDVRLDLQGKAIYSKHKMLVGPKIKLNNIEATLVQVFKNSDTYHLVSAYLTPPLNQKNKSENEKELLSLTDWMKQIQNPAFVFGELNRVYWAKPIIQFRKKTNLMNSRRNVELSFKTPYNHIFYTGDVECYHFEDILDETNVTIGCRGLYQKKKIVTNNRKFIVDES